MHFIHKADRQTSALRCAGRRTCPHAQSADYFVSLFPGAHTFSFGPPCKLPQELPHRRTADLAHAKPKESHEVQHDGGMHDEDADLQQNAPHGSWVDDPAARQHQQVEVEVVDEGLQRVAVDPVEHAIGRGVKVELQHEKYAEHPHGQVDLQASGAACGHVHVVGGASTRESDAVLSLTSVR